MTTFERIAIIICLLPEIFLSYPSTGTVLDTSPTHRPKDLESYQPFENRRSSVAYKAHQLFQICSASSMYCVSIQALCHFNNSTA